MIRISNVSKKYGKQVALENINLDIPIGNIFGIVGPNSTGKSI